jgi:hypothetical protein
MVFALFKQQDALITRLKKLVMDTDAEIQA